MLNKSETVTLKSKTGKLVDVKLGFSWSTAFLSFFPDLIRGYFKLPLIVLLVLAMMVINLPADVYIAGSMIIGIVYAALRNKHLLQYYLDKGYTVIDGDKKVVDEFLGYETTDKVWGG